MDKNEALLALTALSQDKRLDVFRLLVQAGPNGMPAGTIADKLNSLQNTMSTNLAILERAGLILKKREGRSIRYRANYLCMRELLFYLMQNCCGCQRSEIDQALNALFPHNY
ncbi:MAG: helix-turn-helix domain-containing protein [Pseudomonadota bacterium]